MALRGPCVAGKVDVKNHKTIQGHLSDTDKGYRNSESSPSDSWGTEGRLLEGKGLNT